MSPEDTARNGEPRSSDTGVMTTFSDHSSTTAATHRRRKRRDVHGHGTAGPTQILSGASVKRIVTSNDGLVRGLRGVQQRLLIDRLLQLQQKRLAPKSESEILVPLSSIIRQLAVNGVCSWWLLNGGGGGDGVPTNNERPQSPITVTDKRASRASNVFSERLYDSALKMRRDRPKIDPMLLMVGIGRK